MTTIFDLLFTKKFIKEAQYKAIKEYSKLGVFSIRNELLFLIYLSILFFTSGIGIIIYKNIDTIGHILLLLLLGIITTISCYFSYTKSKGFSKEEVFYENPLYDYLVLFTTILICTLISYFQYNFHIKENDYSITTLICGIISLGIAYYFDNKKALIISITALGSFVGLTLKIQNILEYNFLNDKHLLLSGLVFGTLLIIWQYYSEKNKLKLHFSLVILTFALHLLFLTCLIGIVQEKNWILYSPILGLVTYYFYIKSLQYITISGYIFTLFYSYIGLNMIFFKVIYEYDLHIITEFLTSVMPFYVVGSIIFFIKQIRDFKKKIYASQ
ncbi:hypothetical protein BWK59_02710 [Flavobacterium davisii]|uniref:DUF2157 domain-containing protein n=1 Tax=Flavobacterium davisii TaxID=2906077 RepID=A0A246GKU8_9FLAO|nr:DUF2157 domain-containing protein [Flavobacterium davisii]OWP84963.1 hypothetical protein BWK59_02710 [Flavobacterium davisii]